MQVHSWAKDKKPPFSAAADDRCIYTTCSCLTSGGFPYPVTPFRGQGGLGGRGASPYVVRIATTGSSRDALMAGIMPAMMPTIAEIPTPKAILLSDIET